VEKSNAELCYRQDIGRAETWRASMRFSVADSLFFEGITEVQYLRLTAAAREVGIDISKPEGEASQMGVTVRWKYAAGRLEVTCVNAPFFISKDQVYAQIRKSFEKALQ